MKNPIGWLIFAAVLLGGAYAIYRWSAIEPVPVAAPPTVAPLAEPAVRYPITDAQPSGSDLTNATDNLPTLAESDQSLRAVMATLFGQGMEKFFHLDRIVHHVVATIDNLPREQAPLQVMPVKPVPGWLVTTGNGAALSIDAKNAARYEPYMRLVESVSTGSLVEAYVRFYPLFQEQYEKLGYPGKYFNDRLVQVIDHLLASPEVKNPIGVTQTRVLYQFTDPDLERLSAGQKIMLRIGDANRTKIKSKLAAIRAALVVKPPAH